MKSTGGWDVCNSSDIAIETKKLISDIQNSTYGGLTSFGESYVIGNLSNKIHHDNIQKLDNKQRFILQSIIESTGCTIAANGMHSYSMYHNMTYKDKHNKIYIEFNFLIKSEKYAFFNKFDVGSSAYARPGTTIISVRQMGAISNTNTKEAIELVSSMASMLKLHA